MVERIYRIFERLASIGSDKYLHFNDLKQYGKLYNRRVVRLAGGTEERN